MITLAQVKRNDLVVGHEIGYGITIEKVKTFPSGAKRVTLSNGSSLYFSKFQVMVRVEFEEVQQ